MQLVDSHCHINFPDLAGDLDGVLARAAAQQVDYMLCVSVNLEDFPQVRALAERYDHVYASVGVHPNETEGREPEIDELVALAKAPEIVAVGETGLDYFRSNGDLQWQRDRFARHIAAAREAGKPLIIHTREARDDTLTVMRAEKAGEAGGVMHCFTETWDMARAALDLDFYISFSGIVTFRSAEALREVARRVPADRLLVETDSPYLAPVPHRGKTNEPSFVRHVAEFVAELRGVAAEELAEQTTRNFFSLFKAAQRENT